MMSLEIAEGPRLRAALNLYSAGPALVKEHVVDLAQMFGGHAAVAIGLAERIEQLEEALRSRTVIGEAVGLLMERYSLSADRAFRLLVRLSNQSNTKVRDLASTVVDDQGERRTHTDGGGPRPRPRQSPKPFPRPLDEDASGPS